MYFFVILFSNAGYFIKKNMDAHRICKTETAVGVQDVCSSYWTFCYISQYFYLIFKVNKVLQYFSNLTRKRLAPL